jgi:hypothetical protein
MELILDQLGKWNIRTERPRGSALVKRALVDEQEKTGPGTKNFESSGVEYFTPFAPPA